MALNHSAMPISTGATTTTQTQTAARARFLLHTLLLADIDDKPNPTTPSSTPPSFLQLQFQALPTTTGKPTHHHQQQKQPLLIDASTRIMGHGNSLTVPFPVHGTAQPSAIIGQEIILAALAKGVSVEVRTGWSVVGCKNTIAPLPAAGNEGKEAGGKKRRRAEDEDEDEDGEGGKEEGERDAKKEKVEG